MSLGESDYQDMLQKGWGGGLKEGTPCGRGSTLANTVTIREHLTRIVAEYGIGSICDAGAGDLLWVSKITWPASIDYRAFDLVPRAPDVVRLDIRSEALPACDLILCRFVLGHMRPEWVNRALQLFRSSGKYLLATTHLNGRNDAEPCTFNRWNLSNAPFDLGKPLEVVADCQDSEIALWGLLQ